MKMLTDWMLVHIEDGTYVLYATERSTGHFYRTSPVIDLDIRGSIARTQNSTYLLGVPNLGWASRTLADPERGEVFLNIVKSDLAVAAFDEDAIHGKPQQLELF